MTDFQGRHYRNVSTYPLGTGRGLFEIREVHFGEHWAMLLHVYTGLRLRTLLIAIEENQNILCFVDRTSWYDPCK